MRLTREQRQQIKKAIDERNRKRLYYDERTHKVISVIAPKEKQPRQPYKTRPSRLSEDEWQMIADLWKQGWQGSDIAYSFGISFANVHRGLRIRNQYIPRRGNPHWRRRFGNFKEKFIDWVAFFEQLEDGKTKKELAADLGLTPQQLHNRIRRDRITERYGKGGKE